MLDSRHVVAEGSGPGEPMPARAGAGWPDALRELVAGACRQTADGLAGFAFRQRPI